MENLYLVQEEYLSSSWGKQKHDDALKVVQDAINEGYVYIFSKFKRTRKINGKKIFKEGWRRNGTHPNFYSCLGSYSEPKQVDFEMPTLISVEGEPKVKYELKVSNWSTWHCLTQLFGEDAFVFSGSRLFVRSPNEAQELINKWQAELTYLDISHMEYVLTKFYSEYDLVRIEKSTTEQVDLWIKELKAYCVDQHRCLASNESLPLFSYGLEGNSKALTERKNARVSFWQAWNKNRTTLF